MNPSDLVEPLCEWCRLAGDAILEVYETDFDVEQKDDNSPVTKADLASHNLLTAKLAEISPELPILSEEAGLPAFTERRGWNTYWLIDPLDGTREFVNRNGEFTVNVALIVNHRPLLGVVYVPVTRTTYLGCEGRGAERRDADGSKERLSVSIESASPVRILGSRSHRGDSLNAYLEQIADFDFRPLGSSLKFLQIAEGSADIYPRFGPTSEWDTAAAQAVVEQAGGQVLKLDGKPLSYNEKESVLNPHFVVIGPDDHDWVGIAQNLQDP